MGSVFGSAICAGIAVLAATFAPGPGSAATVGFPPERAICLPVGLTTTPGGICAAGIGVSVEIRFDGAQPAGLASFGGARARMLSAIGLLSAAATEVGRGAERWRQGVIVGDITLFRVDISVLRAGLPTGGPFAARVPVVNIVGPGPGFGPSDVVFPGEAAARFLLWRRHRERVLEWTGWWGSVLVPFGSVRASSVIDGDVIGFAPRPETGLPPDPRILSRSRSYSDAACGRRSAKGQARSAGAGAAPGRIRSFCSQRFRRW